MSLCTLWVASLLLCICSPILEYCPLVWGSAAECHLQLLERQVYSVANLCPNQPFLSLCHRRHVTALCMSYKINSNSNDCLFSELPYGSVRVRYSRAAAAAHPLKCEVSSVEHPNLQGVSCRPRLVHGMTFHILCLTPKRKMGLREQSIFRCFPEFVFQFSVVQVIVGLHRQFINYFFFPTWACAAGFNDKYNNNVTMMPVTMQYF